MDERELIQSLIEEARAMRDQVPEYEYLTPQQTQALVRVAHLDPEFLKKGLEGLALEPLLAQAIGWTRAQLQEELDLIARWMGMRNELRATLRGVSTSILKRRHRVGRAFLQLYAVMDTLARNPAYGHLYVTLEDMKKLEPLGRKRRKKAAAPQDEGGGGSEPE